jgi:imidazolonepropionase-like amidohydrolase
MKRILLTAMVAIVATLAIAPLCAQTYVIQNATVMTVSKGTIKNGSIVVKDGKIVEVGEKVTIPAGAKMIDGTGQFVIRRGWRHQ